MGKTSAIDSGTSTHRWASKTVLMYTTVLVFNLARGILTPVLPLYMVTLHMSDVEIGLEFAVLGIGTIVFEPLVGILADKQNSMKILIAIIVGASLCYVSYPLARSLYPLFLLQFLVGGLQASLTVYFRFFILELSGSNSSSRGFGFLGGIFSLSSVVGPLIGGALAVSKGLDFEFYISTLVAVASIPLMYISRPQIAPKQVPHSNIIETQRRRRSRTTSSLRELTILGIIAMTVFIGSSVYTSLLPVIVTEFPFSGTAFQVGIMLAIQNLTLVIFQPVFGSLGSMKSRRWISFGLLAGGIMFLGFTLARDIPEVYLLSFVEGLAFSAVNPLALSRFVTIAPSNLRGAAIGIYGGSEDVGIISGPVILSQIWTRFGIEIAYLGIASIYFVTLVAFLALVRFTTSQKVDQETNNTEQISGR